MVRCVCVVCVCVTDEKSGSLNGIQKLKFEV